jgi:hypothetical protein
MCSNNHIHDDDYHFHIQAQREQGFTCTGLGLAVAAAFLLSILKSAQDAQLQSVFVLLFFESLYPYFVLNLCTFLIYFLHST